MIQKLLSHQKGETVTIRCKIHPQARQNKVLSLLENGIYKIDITAVPENGKANEALVAFLSKETGIPKKNIQILAWHTSRIKTVQFIC